MNTKKDKVILDSTEQKIIKSIPKKADREARLSVANNRLFIIALLMGLIVLCAMYFQHTASIRSDNNIKVAWVKMYPNGTWDIDFHDENRQVEFFQTTVDSLLKNWVIRRYSKNPYSINSDYGHCYVFLSQSLQNNFISPNGFNAPAKAAQIVACPQCLQTKIDLSSITLDHYDSDRTKFGKYEGSLYRSNAFATLKTLNADGIENGEPEKVIISLQWRIKHKDEIQADKDTIDINPIGLEILDYKLLLDKSSQNKKKGE